MRAAGGPALVVVDDEQTLGQRGEQPRPVGGEGVDLVEEENARRVLAGELEDLVHVFL